MKSSPQDSFVSSLEKDLKSQKPFDSQFVQAKVNERIVSFEKDLKEKSKSLLLKMHEWKEGIGVMDCEIDEIIGMINRIKTESGEKLIGPILQAGSTPSPTISKEVVFNDAKFEMPQYPNDINFFVLESVGHHINDVTGNAKGLPPLITAIPPGQTAPKFWSSPNDFVFPEFSYALNADEKCFETSLDRKSVV